MNIFKSALIIIMAFLFLLFPKIVSAPNMGDSPLDKKTMYILINQYRAENNILPVQEGILCDYAKERSQEITTDWSHDQFVEDSDLRYSVVCPECENMAENLANNAMYNKQLLESWKKSPGHNRALLDPKWEVMCLETTWKDGVPYVALEFGDIE